MDLSTGIEVRIHPVTKVKSHRGLAHLVLFNAKGSFTSHYTSKIDKHCSSMTKFVVKLLLLISNVDAYRIAIVPKMTNAAFFDLTRDGCYDRAALANNFECVYTAAEQPDVEENIQILNDLVDNVTIDAIAVSVLDAEAYTDVINRGMAMGKPIITFDSDAPDSNRLAYVGTDNYAMGRELAKLLTKIKPDGGKFRCST